MRTVSAMNELELLIGGWAGQLGRNAGEAARKAAEDRRQRGLPEDVQERPIIPRTPPNQPERAPRKIFSR
jgi:hypothetical protein